MPESLRKVLGCLFYSSQTSPAAQLRSGCSARSAGGVPLREIHLEAAYSETAAAARQKLDFSLESILFNSTPPQQSADFGICQ